MTSPPDPTPEPQDSVPPPGPPGWGPAPSYPGSPGAGGPPPGFSAPGSQPQSPLPPDASSAPAGPGTPPPPPGQPTFPGAAPGAASGLGQAPAPYRPPAAQPGIIPLRPLSMGEIFDGAFKALRFNPKVMVGMSVVVLAIATVASTLIQMPVGRVYGTLMSDLTNPTFTSSGTFVFGLTNRELTVAAVSLVASALVMYLISLVLQGLLVVSVSDAAIGRKPSAGQVWAVVRPRLLALLGVSVLASLATALAPLVWGGVMFLLINAGAAVGAAVWFFLGGLVTLVVTLWLTIRLVFVTQTLILERQGVWAAVRRSWAITGKPFWRLLGILLLTSILVGFIAGALGQVFTIPMIFLSATSGAATIALSGAASFVSSIITVPYLAAVSCLLYIDTRMRLEGLDIQLARIS